MSILKVPLYIYIEHTLHMEASWEPSPCQEKLWTASSCPPRAACDSHMTHPQITWSKFNPLLTVFLGRVLYVPHLDCSTSRYAKYLTPHWNRKPKIVVRDIIIKTLSLLTLSAVGWKRTFSTFACRQERRWVISWKFFWSMAFKMQHFFFNNGWLIKPSTKIPPYERG